MIVDTKKCVIYIYRIMPCSAKFSAKLIKTRRAFGLVRWAQAISNEGCNFPLELEKATILVKYEALQLNDNNRPIV